MSRIEHLAEGVTLYLGDCREILPTLGNVDAVVTDPPYGIGELNGTGAESRSKIKGAYITNFPDTQTYLSEVCGPIIADCVNRFGRVALTPGRINMWHYPPPADVGCFYQPAASGCSFWGRPTWQPILFYGAAPNKGEQLRPLHYQLDGGNAGGSIAHKNIHPCQKPLSGWEWLLAKSSKPDEIILDPFMGSGTTGVAAIRLGRKFVGIEIEPVYFEISISRISEAMKQQDFFIEKPKPAKQEAML